MINETILTSGFLSMGTNRRINRDVYIGGIFVPKYIKTLIEKI